MKYVKYISLFVLYLVLHYIEGFSDISGFSIAQLWKMPLLLCLIIYFLLHIGKVKMFEIWSIVLAIESLFCVETLIKPTFAIAAAMKLLPLVLFYHYMVNSMTRETLKCVLLFMSRAICLTSLITLSGLLHPLENYKQAESFGVGEISYYASLFGAPHAASSYFAIAIIVLLFFIFNGYQKSKFWRLFDFALLLVAFFSIFYAYVRTGWLMVLFGFITLIGFGNFIRKPKYLILLLIIVVGIVFLYQNNEMFFARITGVNIYKNIGGETIDLNGSGRMNFWGNGIELWMKGNPYELFFGQGYSAVTMNNYVAEGLDVFSHNLFIDTLSQHGLVGLVLLLLTYIYQYKFIKKRKHSPYYRLGIAIFTMSLVFSIFQGQIYFDFAIIYSACLAILVKENSMMVNYSKIELPRKLG